MKSKTHYRKLCAWLGLERVPAVTQYTVCTPKLPPAFDGFLIAHLSDLHSEQVLELGQLVSAKKPDIIAITGDMVEDTGSFAGFVSQLECLMQIAPCYLVSGNHDIRRPDYPAFVKACRGLGGIFLENSREWIVRGTEKIAISGIQDPYFSKSGRLLEKTRQDSIEIGRADAYEILLFHRASLFDAVAQQGYDLVLAGHMHGGQIRLPGLGGVVAPRSSLWEHTRMLFPKYTAGLYETGDTKMIVSRGLSNSIFIPRLWNRREIGMITLRREGKA